MENVLPTILKQAMTSYVSTPQFLEATKQAITSYASTPEFLEVTKESVNNCVSSPEFISCLGESILFDTKNLEDKVGAQHQEITDLQQKLEKLESDRDDLEQYTRRTNVRIFGIPESEETSTDDQVLDFINTGQ